MALLTELIRISSYLIVFAYIFGISYKRLINQTDLMRELVLGFLFSIMAIFIFLTPVELYPGIYINNRVILIVYSGIFAGPWALLITGITSVAARIILGGVGMTAGVLSIFLAVITSYLLRWIFLKGIRQLNLLMYLLLGTFSAVGNIVVFILLRPEDSIVIENHVWLSLLGIYSIVSFFTGLLLNRELIQVLQEKELKESNERKRKALAVANDGYFDLNIEEGQLYLDSNYYRIAGYEPGDFPGTQLEWRKRIHPNDVDMVEKALTAFVTGESDVYEIEYRFLRKDDTWMWIHARAIALKKNNKGSVLRMLGTHSDVSETKSVQREMNRMLSAIEHAAEAFVITDTTGTILYVNPAFSTITGYDKKEVIGKNPRFIKSGLHNNLFYKEMWDTIKGGSRWSGQIKNRKKNGEIIIEEMVISPVFNEDNSKILNFVAVKRDITENISLQEQIGQSRKMQALGQLAGGVAHDFNNMLTGIMTATLMLRKMGRLDDKSVKYLGIIEEAVQRSADLTQSLLSFSRKQPQLLNIINLNDSIKKTSKLLRSTLDKRISLEIDLWEGESHCVGDAAQIENALLNLCINASHAIKGEGIISITTNIVHFDERHCLLDPFKLEPGDYIHVSVEDNGAGINTENIDKIFDPFFTTKKKSEGTGLGLTSVYAMIQQHRGSIKVESTEGVGTVFHLYFSKIHDEHLNGEIEMEDARVERTTGETILLVDDELLIRGPLNDMLSDWGYHVITAENGREALDIFHEEAGNIDLVILDVIMPEMDGVTCLQGIREVDKKVPVIIQTGYSSDEKLAKIREIGIEGLLRKPATEEALKKVIFKALDK